MAASLADYYLLKEPAQRRALTSPLRLEMVEHFAHGPLSVTDLAQRMGRRPDSLYYHVRILQDAGLLVPAGTQKRGRREEAVYGLINKTIAVASPPIDPDAIDSAVKTVGAMFRMTERELRTALEQGLTEAGSREQTCIAMRQRRRLRQKAMKEVNEHLGAIRKVIARERVQPPGPGDDAVMCSITVAIIPIADPE